MKNDWETMERELLELMTKLAPAGQQWFLGFETVSTPNGDACCLSIRDDETPGSNIIKITDENLLAKLRSIKGQYFLKWPPQLKHFPEPPIFWHEYLPGRATPPPMPKIRVRRLAPFRSEDKVGYGQLPETIRKYYASHQSLFGWSFDNVYLNEAEAFIELVRGQESHLDCWTKDANNDWVRDDYVPPQSGPQTTR
jgi:hypothetical protein